MLIKVEYNSVNSHAYWGRLRLYKGRLQQSKITLLKSRSQCSINYLCLLSQVTTLHVLLIVVDYNAKI